MQEQVKKAVGTVKEKLDKKTVTTAIGAGGFIGFVYGSDPKVVEHLSTILKGGSVSLFQLILLGSTFLFGVIIHSWRVSRTISENFKKYVEQLTSSIDRVAEALSQDLAQQGAILKEHGNRLDTMGGSVQQLSDRVSTIEQGGIKNADSKT